MREIDIEPPVPTENGHTWTSLRDMPRASSKGKGVLGTALQAMQVVTESPATLATTSTKRRREESPPADAERSHPSEDQRPPITTEDAHLRSYDAASTSVGTFLRGPPLPVEEGETPRQPPKNRPRVHSPERRQLDVPAIQERQISSDSAASATSSSSAARSSGTPNTSPADTPVEAPTASSTTTSDSKIDSYSANADPFGYIPGMASSSSATTSRPPVYSRPEPSIPSVRPISSSSMFPNVGTWGTPITVGSGPLPPGGPAPIRSAFGFNNPAVTTRYFTPLTGGGSGGFGFPSSAHHSLTGRPQTLNIAHPIHSHAYVTLGAGMRQKEVDIYTAENALEGTNRLTGFREERVVPYHIPS